MYTYCGKRAGHAAAMAGFGATADATVTPVLTVAPASAPVSAERQVMPTTNWAEIIAISTSAYPIAAKQTPRTEDPRVIAARNKQYELARLQRESAVRPAPSAALLRNPVVVAGALVALAVYLRR